MNRTISSALRGSVVEEEVQLTMVELGRACRACEQQIELWVVEGVLAAERAPPDEWRFGGDSLARMRLATRLMQRPRAQRFRRRAGARPARSHRRARSRAS